VGGANGRRVSELPAANATTTTDSYDAFYHFEEDRFNVLHELGGNSHGSGQQWFGEFFKVSREKNYPALFRVPQAIPGEPAELRAQMALRTDVTNRFFIEVQGQRITSRSRQ
jgi:hypothetical protein